MFGILNSSLMQNFDYRIGGKTIIGTIMTERMLSGNFLLNKSTIEVF